MIRPILNKLVTAYFLVYDLWELNQVSFDSWFHFVLIAGAVVLSLSLVLPESDPE